MAVPAYESIASTDFASTSSLTISKPSGTVDGDLLVAVIGWTNSSATINSVPSGWTQSANLNATTTLYVYYKVASSEGTDWTWGLDFARTCAGMVLRFSDIDQSTPFDKDAEQSDTNTANVTIGTVTPTAAQSIMLFSVMANQSTTIDSYAIATDNPTWTEHLELNSGSDFRLAVASATRPEGTATGNITFSLEDSSSDSEAVFSIYNGEPDVTIAGSLGTLALNGNVGGVAAGSSVTGSVGSVTLNGNVGTVTTPANLWENEDKNTTTWTNENKS